MIRRSAIRATAIAAPFLFLIGALASSARAEKAEVLRFRHTPGDKAVYDFSVSSRAQATEEGGESVRAEVTVQMKCPVEFLGDTPSGDWGIRGQISSGVMNVTSGGEEQSLDFGDVEARYVVSPSGEIGSHRLISGTPPVLQFAGGVLVLGPEDAFTLAGAAIFPDKPLAKGDTWKGVASVPSIVSGESHDVPYESALLGEERFRGALCKKIKTTRSILIENAAQSPDGSGEARVRIKTSGAYVWLFDPKRGVIMSIQGSENIAVTTTIEQTDRKLLGISATGVINTRSLLTEFNGVTLSDE
ncbi:MAG: hypothetical protein MUQ65_15340 [Armatimonadetes bacterium]|nr:hypothetical protein [Armatimonadota bacterium]